MRAMDLQLHLLRLRLAVCEPSEELRIPLAMASLSIQLQPVHQWLSTASCLASPPGALEENSKRTRREQFGPSLAAPANTLLVSSRLQKSCFSHLFSLSLVGSCHFALDELLAVHRGDSLAAWSSLRCPWHQRILLGHPGWK